MSLLEFKRLILSSDPQEVLLTKRSLTLRLPKQKLYAPETIYFSNLPSTENCMMTINHRIRLLITPKCLFS
jgi:hypothetical protein